MKCMAPVVLSRGVAALSVVLVDIIISLILVLFSVNTRSVAFKRIKGILRIEHNQPYAKLRSTHGHRIREIMLNSQYHMFVRSLPDVSRFHTFPLRYNLFHREPCVSPRVLGASFVFRVSWLTL